MSNWKDILKKLETGEIRAAIKDEHGNWQANLVVKQAILEVFKAGKNVTYSSPWQNFIDKDNLVPRVFSKSDGVRLVPGGSSIRPGTYISKGVIIMPPAYVNIGAYIGEGSMVDGHVLVGSCAQIGKNVHLSAGVQIGGVLEPIGMSPVVIEDNCFIGAGSVIVEGIVIRESAVIAPGVTLSKGVAVYDLVHQEIRAKGAEIPANAVVISGSRPVKNDWGKKLGLTQKCALIIKYRDEKSDALLELEQALR